MLFFKIDVNFATCKSSHLQMFFKIGVLKNFAILTPKHLCWSLFLIKLHAFRPATLLKRDSNKDVFLWILQNFKNSYRPSYFKIFYWAWKETFLANLQKCQLQKNIFPTHVFLIQLALLNEFLLHTITGTFLLHLITGNKCCWKARKVLRKHLWRNSFPQTGYF